MKCRGCFAKAARIATLCALELGSSAMKHSSRQSKQQVDLKLPRLMQGTLALRHLAGLMTTTRQSAWVVVVVGALASVHVCMDRLRFRLAQAIIMELFHGCARAVHNPPPSVSVSNTLGQNDGSLDSVLF